VLRLSVNISTVFTELPMLDRFAAAAEQHFTAVEIQFPYPVPAADLAAARAAAGVECVLINLPAGDLEAGELGLACVPGREADFARSLRQAVTYARALGCSRVNCLAGNIPAGQSRDSCWQVLHNNVHKAAGYLAGHGIKLLLEPLNNADFPSFILGEIDQATQLMRTVQHPNLALQYDIYHRRAAGEDWLGGLSRYMDQIGHIQFSDYPGRHEPGTGELDFAALFRCIESLPYENWTGCEYRPLVTSSESFAWRDLLE
jgi:hydroxypyruvate isomerase